LFCVTPAALEFLSREGTDMKYGARHLKRAIERYVAHPVAWLLATDQLRLGDVLLIGRHAGDRGLAFLRDTERPCFISWSLPSSLNAEMPLPASKSWRVSAAEVRG
jgi:hypothetical protein